MDAAGWEANDMARNPFFAPDRECNSSDPHPILEFSNLADGTVVTERSLPVQGVINVANGGFDKWQLEYGVGQDPAQWILLAEGRNAFTEQSLIYTWDLTNITDPNISLRLYLSNGEGFYAERRVNLTLNFPTPTPTATPTPTLSPTAPTVAPPTDIPTTGIPPTPTESLTPVPTVPTGTPIVVTPTNTP